MANQVLKCRICGSQHLERVLDLGEQELTGVFPRTENQKVTKGPLHLVKCVGGDEVCGLLQLEHSYDLGEMYGENYGYRSGLNASMVKHLHAKVARLRGLVTLTEGDLVVDIGSNDSTTLQAYPDDMTLVGIDPTGTKFHSYYPAHIQLIPDFFSSSLLKARFPGQKAKVVTSFSMYYDLEQPMQFMREVHEVLTQDGIWIFEQSYLPAMLDMNSYDTACHEHLEYYALRQIKWMADRVGFDIIDVEFNDVNGGSFSVTARKSSGRPVSTPEVDKILKSERARGLDALTTFHEFATRVAATRNEFRSFLDTCKREGKTVAAIGASTKGNVLLQYCGVTRADVALVGEVNAEKFGAFTPGSLIPIISESELLARNPDYLVILPWHFRDHFLTAPAFKGRSLVFPLPKLEVVRA